MRRQDQKCLAATHPWITIKLVKRKDAGGAENLLLCWLFNYILCVERHFVIVIKGTPFCELNCDLRRVLKRVQFNKSSVPVDIQKQCLMQEIKDST